MRLRKRCSDEQWERALLAQDVERIKELCQIENGISSRVSKIDPDQPWSPFLVYALAIETGIPVGRFKYLVHFFGKIPSKNVFYYAVDCCVWDIVYYLHDFGFRYDNYIRVRNHFLILPNDQTCISFIFYYPQSWWDKMLHYPCERSRRIIRLAKLRKKTCQNACIAFLSLKKKRPNLIHKDALQIIGRMIVEKDNMTKKEWGEVSISPNQSYRLPDSYFVIIVFVFWIWYIFMRVLK